MRTLSKKQKAAVTGALVLGLSGTGVAYAYWSQGGSGTGSAATGTTVAVTVNQTSTITGLFPGGSPVALAGNFDNPNSSSVTVTGVTGTVTAIGGTDVDVNKPACTTADYTVGGTSSTPGAIPSGTGVGSWSGLTVRMVDNGLNQDNCKGRTITISYTAAP